MNPIVWQCDTCRTLLTARRDRHNSGPCTVRRFIKCGMPYCGLVHKEPCEGKLHHITNCRTSWYSGSEICHLYWAQYPNHWMRQQWYLDRHTDIPRITPFEATQRLRATLEQR